ncbi:MAG: hypothetical protein ABIJ56_19455, partial [Pseudomonadota bacterium]
MFECVTSLWMMLSGTPAVGVHRLVRVIKPLADLHDDVNDVLEGDPRLLFHAVAHEHVQVDAVDEFHGHVVGAGNLAELEDLHDVRVLEGDGDLGLVEKHLDETVALGEVGKDLLDDENFFEAPDAVHLGLENLGHSSLAQEVLDGILAEPWNFLALFCFRAQSCCPSVARAAARPWRASGGPRA